MTPNQPSKKGAYLSRNKLQNRLTEETDTTIAVAAIEPVEELPEAIAELTLDDVINEALKSKVESIPKPPTTEERLSYKKAPKTLAEANIDLNDLFKGFV